MAKRVKKAHPEIRAWLQGSLDRYKYARSGRPIPDEEDRRCELCMNRWLVSLRERHPDWFDDLGYLKQNRRTVVAQMIADQIPVQTCYSYFGGGYEEGENGPFQCLKCLDGE